MDNDGVDESPFPSTLVALTVNVYRTPLARPTIVIGEVEPVFCATVVVESVENALTV
jgi:hypothetical protein